MQKQILIILFVLLANLTSSRTASAQMLSDSQSYGDSIEHSEWFGWYYDAGEGWIYHFEMGWLYLYGSSNSSIFVYHPTHQWMWTAQGYYPFLFRFADNDIAEHTGQGNYNYYPLQTAQDFAPEALNGKRVYFYTSDYEWGYCNFGPASYDITGQYVEDTVTVSFVDQGSYTYSKTGTDTGNFSLAITYVTASGGGHSVAGTPAQVAAAISQIVGYFYYWETNYTGQMYFESATNGYIEGTMHDTSGWSESETVYFEIQ